MTDLGTVFLHVVGPIAGATVGYCLGRWQKRYKKLKFAFIDNTNKYHLFSASEARAQIRIHNPNDYPIMICSFYAESPDGNCNLSVNHSKGTEIIKSKNPIIINPRGIYEAQFNIFNLPSEYPDKISLFYVDHCGKTRHAIMLVSPISERQELPLYRAVCQLVWNRISKAKNV